MGQKCPPATDGRIGRLGVNQPGPQLEALIKLTEVELLLVAPFVKLHTLRHLLEPVSETTRVHVVTRWRVDEIAVGVSDIDVYLLLRPHPNRTLWLRSDLHAKYYRGDGQALVGSANLTHAALGWSRDPNLELLVETGILIQFEKLLFAGSVQVDDTIYAHVKQSVDLMPQTYIVSAELPPSGKASDDEVTTQMVAVDAWLPLLRNPEKLYAAYMGGLAELGMGSRSAATLDLEALSVPAGLNREQFSTFVSVQLLQKPIVRQVDQLVQMLQRFGTVRELLQTLPCADPPDFDADLAWQTLMRWLLHFFPHRYALSVRNHSEIFRRAS
jgi:hypothetical protein